MRARERGSRFGVARSARGLAVLGVALWAGAAAAEGGGAPADVEAGAAPAISASVVDQWRGAVRLERSAQKLTESAPLEASARFLAAADAFEALARRPVAPEGHADPLPERPGAPYWRASRCLWLAGEMLPVDSETERRLAIFRRAEAVAQQGIDADPECAECMLWKFNAMGRVRTAAGVVAGLRGVGEMADLLDRAHEAGPTHVDRPDSSSLGNLHYATAVFYRVLPDWWWLGLFLGARGDKERALHHAREALALHPMRIDFQVEVGSQLLCLGATQPDPPRLEEGGERLTRAIAFGDALREQSQADDEGRGLSERESRQLLAARQMLEQPERSCGYTGDAWVELDESAARELTER